MIRESEHEKEIVLGNRHLLSIFFIVAAMMGVSFTIGYMIGRNTANAAAAVNAHPAAVPPDSTPADSSQTARANPAPTQPSAAPAVSTPPAGTQPAGTQPAKPYDNPQPEKAASDTPSDISAKSPAAESAPASPKEGGSYLQVAALKRQDADHIVKILREHGFPALLGESPKEGLFRVLVGPFHDMTSLADSKQKLRAAGFDSIVAR